MSGPQVDLHQLEDEAEVVDDDGEDDGGGDEQHARRPALRRGGGRVAEGEGVERAALPLSEERS